MFGHVSGANEDAPSTARELAGCEIAVRAGSDCGCKSRIAENVGTIIGIRFALPKDIGNG